jgi:polysaccharide export outer membrane protein
MITTLYRSVLLAWLALAAATAWGQAANTAVDTGEPAAAGSTPPPPAGYVLRTGDTVEVRVFDEPDLSATGTIDASGRIAMPLLREVNLGGLTISAGQNLVERRFRDEQILIKPQVTIQVSSYGLKQVHVFGEVRAPGPKVFPANVTSMDIMEVISLAGDFTDLAKTSAVSVIRKMPDGSEEKIMMDVSRIRGRERSRAEMQQYVVVPGDVITVPERLF